MDVYSFGILLWELCSLEKPFDGYNSKKHMKDVVIAGERPKMDGAHTNFWPADLRWLVTRSWSSDPEMRPPFTLILKTLGIVLEELELPQTKSNRSRSDGTNHGVDDMLGATPCDGAIAAARKGPRLFKIPRMISRP